MTARQLLACSLAICSATLLAQGQSSSSDEEVARNQLASGRAFLRQGNYSQAMQDFKAVAETHPSSSVADNAWIEIARYYLDIANDVENANGAVDTILKKYPTSDSAPEAYVMAGRLALAHSHQVDDLDKALANFERVPRLFPASDAVPRSLQQAGQTLWYWRRFEDALSALGRVEVEYATDLAAADAYLTAGKVQVSLGDPISAMEELQQVRNRWPNSPKAATALAHITLLNRLYMRAKSGPAYALTSDSVGPAKLENFLGLTRTASNAIYWASETGFGAVVPADAPKPPTAVKPRGLTVDAAGNLIIFDGGVLKPITGSKTYAFFLPRPNGTQQALIKLSSVIQLSTGDWIVADEDEKGLFKYDRGGQKFLGIFAPSRITKLAVNAIDEIAGIDRDQKSIVILDAAGKLLGKLPLKGANYDLQDAEDIAYDGFGHLYVLDRTTIAVFSPYGAAASAPSTAARGAAPPAAGRGAMPAPAGTTYRLVTMFSEDKTATAGFHKAMAFVVDESGTIYVYDDNLKKILVYR